MKVDRVLQIKILECLAEFYPGPPPNDLHFRLLQLAADDENALIANLQYLWEEGLINKDCLVRTIGNPLPNFIYGLIQITSKGQNILQDDGGLAAVKNTVTVRFHADTLSAIEKFILEHETDQNKKSSLVARLRQLPFSATEHLMKKLLDEAFLHAGDVLQLIEKALH